MPQEDKCLIIRVDLVIRPDYPNDLWFGEVVYPDLERAGPTEYDFRALDPWWHDGQKNGYQVTGRVIYQYLQENDMIASCLSFLDGQAIRAQVSAADFRRLVKCSCVALWRSVTSHKDDNNCLYVPYIIAQDNKLVVDWYFLGWYFDGRIPALRFPESMLNTAPVIP